jgi:hypothetical protein
MLRTFFGGLLTTCGPTTFGPQNERLYIQVAKEITEQITEIREYERLLGIRVNYPKYVLRTDDFAAGNYEGIKTMHVADFLLSSEF